MAINVATYPFDSDKAFKSLSGYILYFAHGYKINLSKKVSQLFFLFASRADIAML